MSSTNKTTNYELPLFIGTDKPTWLGDFNGAMNKIDTAVKAVSDVASGNTSTIGGVQDDVNSLETQVGTLENTVSGHTSTIASQGASITGLQTTVNQHSTQISAINEAIGRVELMLSTKTQHYSITSTSQTAGYYYQEVSLPSEIPSVRNLFGCMVVNSSGVGTVVAVYLDFPNNVINIRYTREPENGSVTLKFLYNANTLD